jgi:hypothetical protein
VYRLRDDVRLRRADGVLTRRTPRSLVALANDSDAPVRLEGAAVAVWDMLHRAVPCSSLVTQAARGVGVHQDQIAEDVAVAVDVLVGLGLVVSDSP